MIAVDHERTTAFALPPASVWSASRDDWIAALSRSPRAERDEGARRARSDAIQRGGEDLERCLLPPQVRECLIDWEVVSIVGADLLGELPFEALPARGAATLGLEKAIQYLPSLALAARLERRIEAAPWRSSPGAPDLCLIAASTDPGASPGSAGQVPLPWDEETSRRLTAPYGRAEVRTGARATRRVLETLELMGARVLHLVAHGAMDTERERWAGLALAGSGEQGDDGFLGCSEVGRLRMPPLVVLSVCGGSRGPGRRGDDAQANLVGAFLRAGAQVVVSSPVDVELESNVEAMEVFHRLVARGERPVAALREARRALAADERYADPYYHSLLHLTGLGERPLFPTAPDVGAERAGLPVAWLLGPGLALLALAGALIVVARRARRAGS